MHSPSHNPSRRNRNIGTGKQGHGQNNRDRIPWRWRDSVIDWARGHPHHIVMRPVWGRDMPFLVERTRADCVHACSVDDLARMLNLLPKEHINNRGSVVGIRGVVLRQPTRKEQQLSGVWGRLGYSVRVDGLSGPVIFLEAVSYPYVLRWDRSTPQDLAPELERNLASASFVEETPREFRMHFPPEAVRERQLFHTLPHELGHAVDMLTKVELPGEHDFEAWEALWDRYFQRPSTEREAFAHRYADEQRARLIEAGEVPFPSSLTKNAVVEDGLHWEDFSLDENPA